MASALMRRSPVWVTVALLAALVVASPASALPRKAGTIPMAQIESYASQIAGSPVTIVCDSDETRGGYVRFDGVIHLQPWVCPILMRVDRPTIADDYSPAYALLALQHEATHIALHSYDEGLVECTAVSNRWQLVRQFKLPAKLARKLMDDELTVHLALMPPAYRAVC